MDYLPEWSRFTPQQSALRDDWWKELQAMQVSIVPNSAVGFDPSRTPLGRSESVRRRTTPLDDEKNSGSSASSSDAGARWESLFPVPDRFKSCDHDILDRCCVDYHWRKEKIFDLVAKHSRWRKEEKIDEIGRGSETFPGPLQAMLMGFCGRDQRGRPIYYDRPQSAKMLDIVKKCSITEIVRWHIATAEAAKALRFEVGTSHFVSIVDASEVSLLCAAHPGFLWAFRHSSVVDHDYYPDAFAELYVVKPPTSVKIMWSLVRPFIDDHNSNKIHFCSTHEEANEKLGITYDQVPVEFGGKVENGMMEIQDILHSFEKRSDNLPFGYGKHKSLLPKDAFDLPPSTPEAGSSTTTGSSSAQGQTFLGRWFGA